jgi:hypothetical protein
VSGNYYTNYRHYYTNYRHSFIDTRNARNHTPSSASSGVYRILGREYDLFSYRLWPNRSVYRYLYCTTGKWSVYSW